MRLLSSRRKRGELVLEAQEMSGIHRPLNATNELLFCKDPHKSHPNADGAATSSIESSSRCSLYKMMMYILPFPDVPRPRIADITIMTSRSLTSGGQAWPWQAPVPHFFRSSLSLSNRLLTCGSLLRRALTPVSSSCFPLMTFIFVSRSSSSSSFVAFLISSPNRSCQIISLPCQEREMAEEGGQHGRRAPWHQKQAYLRRFS